MDMAGTSGVTPAALTACGRSSGQKKMKCGSEVYKSDAEMEWVRSDGESDGKSGEAFGGRRGQKRKTIDCDDNLSSDGILSNEDFQRIKELKMKKEAKLVMNRQVLKIPDSEQLRMKRVDPLELQAHIKLKLTKEERLELVKAGREERGKYRAKTAIKQRKRGGLSNREKEQKKSMPLAAKRSKVAKSKQENKRKQRNNQFRGRKAWK